MAESVYKVIDLIGSSEESWEKAAAAAINQASKTLRDIRVATVIEQDIHIEPGRSRSSMRVVPNQFLGDTLQEVDKYLLVDVSSEQ